MAQEDKKLLLKDLCARLAYGVQIEIEGCRGGVLKGFDYWRLLYCNIN